jgi:hypothetical protein
VKPAAVALVLVVALATGCQYQGIRGTRVAVWGDSIGARAEPFVRHRLVQHHRVTIDATGRAVTFDKLVSMHQVAGADPGPDVAVVELGAGDANLRSPYSRVRRDIRLALWELRSVPCVRWLTLKVGGVDGYYAGYVARARTVNQILAQEVARTTNARTAAYRYWAAQHPEAFLADGLHHNRRGKALFARFIDHVVHTCG